MALLSVLLDLYAPPQDVGFRVWWGSGAIGRLWPYRTFGYAGSRIWLSENSILLGSPVNKGNKGGPEEGPEEGPGLLETLVHSHGLQDILGDIKKRIGARV